jgi:hypothetical protein
VFELEQKLHLVDGREVKVALERVRGIGIRRRWGKRIAHEAIIGSLDGACH